ncbi:hypothetical protein [Piscibacillus salipiscarius]|uniref:Uncharacterized protein n=1 Tax=Piscibacillus salipiscarius TaxID=299480 RepID=A0ABW5QDH3_9BACI
MKWLHDLEKILIEIGKQTEKKGGKEYKHLTEWDTKLAKDLQNLEKFGKEFESWFDGK